MLNKKLKNNSKLELLEYGYRWSSFEFVSSNFDLEDNRSKFLGQIKFIHDKNGIIYDYIIEFKSLSIDIYTTKSWFENKNKNYLRRKALFEKLEPLFKQEIRPEKGLRNKVVELSENNLKIFNNFINYKTQNLNLETLKSIIALIRGNNPSGEIQNHKSGQMLLVYKNKKYNFVTFFKLFKNKNTNVNKKQANMIYESENLKDDYLESVSEITKKIFFDFNQNLTVDEFKIIEKNIELQMKKTFHSFQKIDQDIHKQRRKFRTNNENTFSWKYTPDLEKAHILPVSYSKKKLMEIVFSSSFKHKYHDSVFESDEYQKFLGFISDKYNFLFLHKTMHFLFDKLSFTYSANSGKIKKIIIDELDENNIENFFKKYENLREYFSTIPKEYLSPERKNF